MIASNIMSAATLLNSEWLKACAISLAASVAVFILLAVIVKIAKPFEIEEIDDEEGDN